MFRSIANKALHVQKKTSNVSKYLRSSLKKCDPEVFSLINKEAERQRGGLELIASENFTSKAVMEANGSILTNKYSEGLPGARYYGGNEFIDKIEQLCQRRALKVFGLKEDSWGVNVQPYSGSTANFAALTAVLEPQDRIMGLDLPSGGHLTHGYQTTKKKISATSKYFQSKSYHVNPKTGLVDYIALEQSARTFSPHLIICGGSAYPREWDYQRLRTIADENRAYLLCDMAHISGLVAAGEAKSPFEFADIVTTTTHKTLRGPRAGLIFFKKVDKSGRGTDLENKVNAAVFPACQGGPHNNVIAGVAVALKQASEPDFKKYASQVKKNATTLSGILSGKGYDIVTGGTDNHLFLWNLRPLGLSGSKMEHICDAVHITLNKNAIHGDTSAMSPGGVRIGTAALTTRGFTEKDMEVVAEMLHEAVTLAIKIQKSLPDKLLRTFIKALHNDDEVKQLGIKVLAVAEGFLMPT